MYGKASFHASNPAASKPSTQPSVNSSALSGNASRGRGARAPLARSRVRRVLPHAPKEPPSALVPSFLNEPSFPFLGPGPISLIALLFLVLARHDARASTVTLSHAADGGYILVRDGKPSFVKGGGGDSHLDTLVACGGNSIRTWGIDQLEKTVDGKRLVDRAQELGLGITAGIWIEHERHGFNYDDPAQVRKQRDMVRAAVRKYKHCLAILVWGLGCRHSRVHTGCS